MSMHSVGPITRIHSLGYEFKGESGGASYSSSWVLHGDDLKSLLFSDF